MSQTASPRRERAPWYEILGFAIFDFANSAYTTVIITVVYSVVYPKYIVQDLQYGNFMWSVALAISYCFVVITAPVFGAIMDFSGSKKKFLFVTYLITVVASAALFFVSPGALFLGALFIGISNFGFASGENIVSAFLPELGPPESLGKISGYAWGLGYFGGIGSTLLVMAVTGSPGEGDFYESGKQWIGPITGIFFLLAGIPTFLLMKERAFKHSLPAGESYISIGFKRLRKTVSELGAFRDLLIFLVLYFFAYSGLAIVISFAFIYGDQVIQWDEGTPALMFALTNVSAAIGAVIFGFIQDRIGDKLTYNITLGIWAVAVYLIYDAVNVTIWINGALGSAYETQTVFLFIGSLAGLCLGATQSASRAVTGVFSPTSKAGEFFGFWGIATKLAAAIGIFSLGLLQYNVGLRNAILLCGAFFIIGLIINLFTDEERGRRAAIEHEERPPA